MYSDGQVGKNSSSGPWGGGGGQEQFDFWQWYQQQLMLQQLNNPMQQIAQANAAMPQELQLNDATGVQEQQRAQADYMNMMRPEIDKANVQALGDQPFGGGNTFAAARSGQIASDAASKAYLAGQDAKNQSIDRVSRARASWLGTPYQDMNNGAVQSKLADASMRQPSNLGGDIMSMMRGAYSFAQPYMPGIMNNVKQNGLLPAIGGAVAKVPGQVRNLLFGDGR